MNKLAALTLSLFLVCGTAFADTPKDSDAPPAKPKPPAAAKSEEKSNAAIAAEIEALRQSLESQQEQLQLLKEELAKRDRQIDEAPSCPVVSATHFSLKTPSASRVACSSRSSSKP